MASLKLSSSLYHMSCRVTGQGTFTTPSYLTHLYTNMAGNTQARWRMPLMSPFEQEVLVNIVDSYKTVVENQKNDIHSFHQQKRKSMKSVDKREDQLKKNW